ncbi:MAG: transporter [Verrucomicrobiales bacterium]|nr:transporter [Verrucomicrobiales bacterium]
MPTVITQEAHIVGINYRHSDKFDLILTVPYILQSTDHIRRVGTPFTLESKGLSDLALTANYSAFRYGSSSVVVSAGLSAPSGSIDKTGDTPRGKDTQLPYAMQIGSGTWELHPGITIASGLQSWTFGATLDSIIRLGENDRDYALGDELAFTAWSNYDLSSRIQLAAHVRGEFWDGINGQDSEVNPRIAPVADPATYGGCQAEIGASARFYWLPHVYDDFFIELGGAVPLWQDLNGPQPRQEWEFTFAFGFGF